MKRKFKKYIQYKYRLMTLVSYVISKILRDLENKSKTQSPSFENVSMRYVINACGFQQMFTISPFKSISSYVNFLTTTL